MREGEMRERSRGEFGGPRERRRGEVDSAGNNGIFSLMRGTAPERYGLFFF